MPDLSKPPSRSDDGDFIDGIDECDCTICGELLDAYALELLNDEEASRDDLLATALCSKCQAIEDGDTDEV